MALKKPSDFFGINRVSSLNEEIEKVSLDPQETLIEDQISSSFSNIDSVFRDIQNQLQESSQLKINDIREEVVSLYNVVDDIIENEIPQYKKRLEISELRVETRIKDLRDELCEHLENQVKKTKEKIEELYSDVLEEEVFSAKKFVKDLYHSEIQTAVEKYVSTYSNEIVSLREEVFKEIKKKPSNLGYIESKINDLYSKYKSLSENLNNIDSNDPLLASPVTIEELRNHYQLLVGRLQEQLASIGGGGEVRLQYLDDIVGIATNASAYDGKYLKYDHSIGKFVFESVSGLDAETQTLNNVLSLGNSSSTGINVGISTFNSLVTVGGAVTALYVSGNTKVTGIVTASSFEGNGSNLSGVVTSLVGYATEGYVDLAVAGVVTFSGNYNDLSNKPTIPSDTGDLTNNVGFVTSGIVVGYATEGYVDNAVVGFVTSGIVVGYATEGYVDNSVVGFITSGASGSNLTGIVTSITAGSGIVINQSTGNVTISNNIIGGYFVKVDSGIHTTSNVGVGTTNPITTLQVERYGVDTTLGSWTASSGVLHQIDSISTDFQTAEYTLHFSHSSGIQAQKVLLMHDGSISHAQEYGIMSSSDPLVSIGHSMFGGNLTLNVTPETGITGIVTYRFTRQTML